MTTTTHIELRVRKDVTAEDTGTFFTTTDNAYPTGFTKTQNDVAMLIECAIALRIPVRVVVKDLDAEDRAKADLDAYMREEARKAAPIKTGGKAIAAE